MTNTAEVGGNDEGFNFPYMIFEFVDGDTLTTLGSNAKNRSNKNGYYLHSVDDHSFTKQNQYRSDMIMYQIIHFLYQLKRIKIFGKDYGFLHADLNPGNIMIKRQMFSARFNAGFGDIVTTDIPEVTFIDLGHATSDLDDMLGPKVKSIQTFYFEKLRLNSGSAKEFYANLTGKHLAATSTLTIGITSTNADVRLFRILAVSLFHSLNTLFPPLMANFAQCTTRTECVENAKDVYKKLDF